MGIYKFDANYEVKANYDHDTLVKNVEKFLNNECSDYRVSYEEHPWTDEMRKQARKMVKGSICPTHVMKIEMIRDTQPGLAFHVSLQNVFIRSKISMGCSIPNASEIFSNLY